MIETNHIKFLTPQTAKITAFSLLEDNPYDIELTDIHKTHPGVSVNDYYSIRNDEIIQSTVGVKPTLSNIIMFSRVWKPIQKPIIAHVLAFHGFGEHILRYNHIFNTWAKNGILILGFDQRGFGRTGLCIKNENSSSIGKTGGYKTLLNDADTFLFGHRKIIHYDESLEKEEYEDFIPAPYLPEQEGIELTNIESLYDPNIPLFIFGHDMGGTLALLYGRTRISKMPYDLIPKDYQSIYRNKFDINIRGIICNSPTLRLTPDVKPNAALKYMASYISYLVPDIVLDSGIDDKNRSLSLLNNIYSKSDILIHNKGSLEHFISTLSEGEWLLKESKELEEFATDIRNIQNNGLGILTENTEVLISVGDQDKISENKSTIDFIRSIIFYLSAGRRSINEDGQLIIGTKTGFNSNVRPRGCITKKNDRVFIVTNKGITDSKDNDNEPNHKDSLLISPLFPISPNILNDKSRESRSSITKVMSTEDKINKWKINIINDAGHELLNEQKNVRDALNNNLINWIISKV